MTPALDPFDTRAALAAKVRMEREHYLLSGFVVSALWDRRASTLAQVLHDVRRFDRHATRSEVLHILTVYEGCGRIVARCVRGRTGRYSLAQPWSQPRRGKSGAWREAAARRAAIRRMVLSWTREEGDAFYRGP